MNTLSSRFSHFVFGSDTGKHQLTQLGFLLLRFYAGFTIMSAGMDKLPLPDWLTDQVVSIGFPVAEAWAWIAAYSQFAFGALLCLGILTRLSGWILAINLGVAAFGFHGVSPLVDMHITQHFLWIFCLLGFTGAGTFSIDYLISNKLEQGHKMYAWISLPALLIPLGIALYWESNAIKPIPQTEEDTAISSINIPGSHNEWNPASNEMETKDSLNYIYQLDIEFPQVFEFKFTANKNWNINLGEQNQDVTGFPLRGKAELDQGNNTQNIRTYLPHAGQYIIKFNAETYDYSLESVMSEELGHSLD